MCVCRSISGHTRFADDGDGYCVMISCVFLFWLDAMYSKKSGIEKVSIYAYAFRARRTVTKKNAVGNKTNALTHSLLEIFVEKKKEKWTAETNANASFLFGQITKKLSLFFF